MHTCRYTTKRRQWGKRWSWLLGLLFAGNMSGGVKANEFPDFAGKASGGIKANEFLDLSLNELLSLEITSVSKRPQPVSQAAAAVFVITQEDIRRSGATSIPEALRMAPGLHVARIDGNKWAISARGFNGRFATKMLVLIDGRSVYSPLFAGVFWDIQDTLLDDVERIEVIRGPGASLWGSNAVNGVIDIITKSAADTRGGLVSAGGGSQETGFGGVRYGGRLGETGRYRVYAKYLNRDGNRRSGGGGNSDDRTEAYRAGFRTDLTPSAVDTLTLQGEYYQGLSGETSLRHSLTPPFLNLTDDDQRVSGFHMLSRWRREISDTDTLTLQAYFDRTRRNWYLLDELRDTADLDVQYRSQAFEGHDLLFGFGYRYTRDDTEGSRFAHLNPGNLGTQLFSAFLQDDIQLIPSRLVLTLGSKLEHNDYTGFEGQPNARLLWTPTPQHTVWASIGRAVRIPSRGDQHALADRSFFAPYTSENPGPVPVFTKVFGSPDYDAESVIAYEFGYKQQVSKALSFDVAFYHNEYTRLRGAKLGTPACDPAGTPPGCFFGSPHPRSITMPIELTNQSRGESYGMEWALEFRPAETLRFQGAYTLADSRIKTSAANIFVDENPLAHHLLSLRAAWNPRSDVDLDLWLRYVDRMAGSFGTVPTVIPAYTQLDLRLAWRILPKLELSVTGQNLLDGGHPEYQSELGDIPLIDLRRSVYGQIRWNF